MHNFWLITPIILVLGIALYFIWAFNKQKKHYETKKEIMKSGDRGEYKVQAVLRTLQKSNSRYRVYHNIKLGPDPEHTNEYDTVIVGPNGIFHIETKNYGGERGGIIDIDSRQNWILHKKNGYSKIIANPVGQVDSHEYRLKGFLKKVVGVRNVPTQGIIVLSCDKIKLRVNKDLGSSVPILTRHELVPYIRNYRQGKVTLYPRTIKKICQRIEDMNSTAQAR